jgi:membrane protein implicated in regulation of membrane protease activity
MIIDAITLDYIVGSILGLVTGFATGALSTVLGYKLRERAQDRRERKRKDEELHGAALKVLTEVEHNREARFKLIEEIPNTMPLPHDAHEAL